MQAVPGRTLFEKVWAEHEIMLLPGGVSLLRIDRHLIHDLEAGPGLARIERQNYRVRRPDLTFATPDHAVSSDPLRGRDSNSRGGELLREMRRRTAVAGVRLFDLGDANQGIVHVIGPELGLTLPGSMIVCGDSHTCTHGGLGALAFGIGSSEVAHVLATQTLRQTRPKTMRIQVNGALAPNVTSKDLMLFLIGRLGTAAGRGHAVEFAGSTLRTMDIEARLAWCNMSIELGAKIGMIAPDDLTYTYLRDRPFAPKGALFDRALNYWRQLPSDPDAAFDREEKFDAGDVAPQITWGVSPQDVIGINELVPDPGLVADSRTRESMRAALNYMGLEPGRPIEGTDIDWVFIGSCANGRLSDLRAAAAVARGRKVAPNVRAWIVPGSEAVRRAAIGEGLDRVFIEAGFEWRAPGCSLCLGANGEILPPKARSVSTSNRNFIGRQGPEARTHLASPAMAAAAAIQGKICDVRKFENLS